jgi:HEAT repeat protein
MPELGSPGFKGYDYQITATVWIALELFLVQQRSEEILVEPLSHEDVEASIRDNAEDGAASTVETLHGTEHLYIQVKRRSTGPWSVADFADVFVGTLGDSKDRRSRQRPWEFLENDRKARYLLLTDAAVNESLMPYSVSGLLLRHSSSTVPSSIKARAKVSDASAGQFAILPMQVEELLTYRITDLLLRKGHVPSLRTALCFEALRDEVRDRLLGKKPAALTITDISSTLRQFGGQPFINPRLAEYVPPLSYAEIEARLRNQNAVLLVGPPGTGKTMTSEIIAARSAADGVNIIREKSPDKIRDLISQSGRFLFLLSDPWGATRVDEKAPVNWTDELPKLLEFANPDKRFVITSRSDVLRTAIGNALIVEDKQLKRKYGLSSIAMRLFPEDYNSDLRKKILRNKAGRLSAWQQDFVSRHETAITRKLRLPFSIERFVSYLGQVADPAKAILEDLLNSADSDAIVNTVRQQVEAWGAGQVECAAAAWALLNSWNPLELELSDRVTVTLSDTGLVLELQSFFKHLLACGNIKLDGTSIEAHPKVIEALEQVLAGKPSAAAETIQKLMDAIAGPAQSNIAMASLLFDTARAVQSGRFLVQRDIPTQAKAAIFQIIENKLASKERSVFLEGLREASDFNLTSQLGMLVRQLVGESKSNDRWFRHWSRPPNTEITEEFTAWVVASSTGLNVLRLFVEFSLPATEVTYAVQEFLGYLRSFPVDLSSSFMHAFDTVVDREQVCFNDDVIVTGSLTGEASSQHVRARILKLWESNEAWFGGFSEQLSAARECELDAEHSAHLEEEPGEHFGLAEGLAKAYVAVRRDREGWQWLTQPDNQRFISAWSEMIAEAKTTPSTEEWEALAKACRESHMSEYWSAVKAQKRWDRLADVPVETFSSRYSAKAFLEALISAVDPIAVFDQISSSLDNSSRATLVATAAGMSTTKLEEQSKDISHQSILDVLTKTSHNTNEARCLAMLFDLVTETPFSTIREKHGAGPTRELQELARSLRSRNEQTCSCVAVLSAVLNEVDDSLLDDLLASSDTEVSGNAALAAAVAGRDSLLQFCLSHKHYQVRRTAFKALSRSANPQLMDRLLAMAKDKSAAVRLEVARTIGNLEWTDARGILVTLLSDSRDYSQDSLTGGWPCFEVARAAADSIQQIPLDDETESELIDFVDQGRKATADPIVRAKVILALSNSQKPTTWTLFFRMLNSSLAIGKEPAPRYILRCAAAEAIAIFLTRTPTALTSEQADCLLRSCQTQDEALSVRATIATALSFESTSEKFGQLTAISKRQTELFVVAALASGKRVPVEFVRALLGDNHALLSLLRTSIETGTPPATLTPEIESWIDGLNANQDVARAILYTVKQWLEIASDKPESPWNPDLEPKRIPTITLRSMVGGE